MSSENQNPASPEGLSLDEVLGEYINQHNERMHDIVQLHDMAVDTVNGEYAAHIDGATPQTAPAVFKDMERHTAEALRSTPLAVGNEIATAATALVEMISDEDRDLLNGEITEAIRTFGIRSEYVTRAKHKATSPTAEKALDIILDTRVAGQMQSAVDTFRLEPRSFEYIEREIRLASSPEVKKALRASLDAQVLDYARHQAHFFGPGSEYVTRVMSLASTSSAQTAMEHSFDGLALNEKHRQASTMGEDSDYTARAIRHGSSPKVREFLKHSPSTRWIHEGHHPYPTHAQYLFDGEDTPTEDKSYGLTNADIYRNYFTRQSDAYFASGTKETVYAVEEFDAVQTSTTRNTHRRNPEHRGSRRGRLARRASAVLLAGAALFTGIKYGAPAAIGAYERHQAGIERVHNQEQQQLGDVVQPALNQIGNSMYRAYGAWEKKHPGDTTSYTETTLPDNQVEITANDSSNEVVMGTRVVNGTRVPNPKQTEYAYVQIAGDGQLANQYFLATPKGQRFMPSGIPQGQLGGNDFFAGYSGPGLDGVMSIEDSTVPNDAVLGDNWNSPAAVAQDILDNHNLSQIIAAWNSNPNAVNSNDDPTV